MYTSKYFVGVTLLTLMSGIGQASLANFDPLNPTGEGCVDSKGFLDGVQENMVTFVGCGERCKNPQIRGARSETECLSACRDIQYMNILETWVESCWNQVYSCEYQITALKFLGRTSLRGSITGGIPFYPPPGDAKEGACSCNLGYVEGNQTVAAAGINNCVALSFSRDTGPQALDCMCCGYSQSLAAYNICPNSDLAFMDVGTPEAEEVIRKLESPDSCAILDNNADACQSTYNFSSSGVAPVNPFKLPSVGKEALSNIPGNAFTAYVSQVITVTFDGYSPQIITLAPWDAKAGAATATGSGKGTHASATATGASAGNSGSAASTGNSARVVGAPNLAGWIGGSLGLVFWGMW